MSPIPLSKPELARQLLEGGKGVVGRLVLSSSKLSEEAAMEVAVIGAGTMGRGIAQVFAQSGSKVWLVDVRDDILKRALGHIKENLTLFEEEKILSSRQAADVLSRIDVVVDPRKAVRNVEFVTEAVTEDLTVKKHLFKLLGEASPKDAILASNTSGLNVSDISSETAQPERVIGTNWWNPAQIIPLVEVMRGEKTSADTLERTRRILTNAGKKPITIMKSVPGFVGNRLQIALFREALHLLEQGVATLEDIDTAVSFGPGFRYPVLGPFRVSDFGGLDVFYHLCGELFGELDSSTQPPSGTLKRLAENNRFGVKSGAGFYDYSGLPEVELVRERDRKLLRIYRTVSGQNPGS